MLKGCSKFSWINGPAVISVEYHGDVAILSHYSDDAGRRGWVVHSVVRGGKERLACCPTIGYARRFVAKIKHPTTQQEVAA